MLIGQSYAISQFLIKYLNLPLSIKKPKKEHYLLILANVQKHLVSWKSKLLNMGGRATLIKAVLNALPLHFMQAFLFPSWLIKHIEQIKMRFLWRGATQCYGGHCLINWTMMCLPKECGGMGQMDISNQNKALLMKWLWIIYVNTTSLLASTLISHYTMPTPNEDLPNGLHIPSFFLQDLFSLISIFKVSISLSANISWKIWT